MDSVDRLDVIKRVEEAIALLQPQTVYTHFSGDLNIDHRICNEAVVTACRPTPSCSVRQVLFFEVASSTEWVAGSYEPFEPNWYVDVSATWSIKLEALACYGSEMRPWPNARSVEAVEALGSWRGASVGVDRAEAFVLGRRVVR
jgi:LmbE family N-acetylglucosaminyl deacetylase